LVILQKSARHPRQLVGLPLAFVVLLLAGWTTMASAAEHKSFGTVCGATWLIGGPYQPKPQPNLLRSCPSGSYQLSRTFKLKASNGTLYSVRIYRDRRWSADVPAGTYRALAPGCPLPGSPFVVTAGKTLRGVVIRYGCDYL
jgi:hypothetical protein